MSYKLLSEDEDSTIMESHDVEPILAFLMNQAVQPARLRSHENVLLANGVTRIPVSMKLLGEVLSWEEYQTAKGGRR